MNDPDHVHLTLDAAFASRAESVSAEPPPFHGIAERGQQRTRRTLAAATIGVVAIGAAGLLAATSFGNDDPSQSAVGDALPSPSDDQFLASATTVQLTTWACSGPIGSSDDGSITYYQSCEPQPLSAPIPTPTTIVEVTSFCTESDETTASTDAVPCPDPADESPTTTLYDPATTVPCTIAGCRFQDGVEFGYELQDGDYPLGVAEAFCVTVDDLLEANGWTGAEEFGFPGEVIRIPPATTECP